jgi:hypothetical protein
MLRCNRIVLARGVISVPDKGLGRFIGVSKFIIRILSDAPSTLRQNPCYSLYGCTVMLVRTFHSNIAFNFIIPKCRHDEKQEFTAPIYILYK